MSSDDSSPKTDTTIGVYIGEGDGELIERIDEEVDWRNSSRSDWWKNAARLRLDIDELLQEAGMKFPGEREKRHFIRQAIQNEIAREADGE